jgi:hypothetical protein
MSRKKSNYVMPPKTENPDGTVVLRMTPDRAKNLEGIAEAIEKLIDEGTRSNEAEQYSVMLHPRQQRQVKGYCEQLRIIANDLRK